MSDRYCRGKRKVSLSNAISLLKSRILPQFAAICRAEKVVNNRDSVMEKAKYGKMRQVNAVNGSQMVVKIGVVYYRRVKEIDREISWKLSR